ncbi:MAG: bacteriocin fulvocin C-related protein [Acidobacteriota bacterium]|nr:bacteriocin fulvocin C-related protein [Acidobacteriota bacterium]
MWGLSSAIKAELWNYNIERYLRDHPDLSAEAQVALRDGMLLVTTPGWFDIQDGSPGYLTKTMALANLKSRITAVLTREAIVEAFIRLGPEPVVTPSTTVTSPRLVPQTDIDVGVYCHCGSVYDCGSSMSYGCYSSWCLSQTHCGFYSDEVCWGKCKSTGY